MGGFLFLFFFVTDFPLEISQTKGGGGAEHSTDDAEASFLWVCVENRWSCGQGGSLRFPLQLVGC